MANDLIQSITAAARWQAAGMPDIMLPLSSMKHTSYLPVLTIYIKDKVHNELANHIETSVTAADTLRKRSESVLPKKAQLHVISSWSLGS